MDFTPKKFTKYSYLPYLRAILGVSIEGCFWKEMPCQDKTTNIFSGWGVLAGRAGTPLFYYNKIQETESLFF